VSKMPLVSIVMPTFKPRYFEEALLSAINQTYKELEIFISDDCPDAGIQEIVSRHVKGSRIPIRYVRNNIRLADANLTQCIVEARGEYVKFLNDDDVLMPDCVERMMDVFLADNLISIVTSRRKLIDEEGVVLADILPTHCPFDNDVVLHPNDLIGYLAERPMNFIGEPSTVLLRRTDLLGVQPNIWSLNGVTIRAISDLAIYVNVLRLGGQLAYLINPLSCFRLHAEQNQKDSELIAQAPRDYLEFTGQIKLLKLYLPRGDGVVRCRSLVPGSNWHESPLRSCFMDTNKRISLASPGGVVDVRCLGGVYSIEAWSAARKITSVEAGLINGYLYKGGVTPLFGIFILDLEGDMQGLLRTIKSMRLECEVCPSVSVIALTVGSIVADDDIGNVQFVPLETDSYVKEINSMVECGGFDWLMLVQAGDEFSSAGLMRMALEMKDSSVCRAVYGDEFIRLPNGSLGGVFRPSFNLDLLLSFPAAMSRHWLFSRGAFMSVGGFDSSYKGALELDLLLRLIEQDGLSGFGHVDEPLLVTSAPNLVDEFSEKATILRHLQVRGYQADFLAHLPGRYRIAYNHQAQPLVSIIVPTKDQLPMLQRCVESLLEKTDYAHYELLIVDNNSETVEAREWLAAVEQMGEARVRVLRYPYPFNYSAINNMAAREARGEYLVLLNNDTAIISESWLGELLNHAQRPEVGIVGAKLLLADGTIQHAGIILGLRGANRVCGPAQHPFVGEAMDAPGFMNRLQVDQNYSAVTAACLMIRKSIYDEVGGLDEENFKVSYNDVDLCLKVGELGYLTVWTPHAVVMHEGSVSQKQVDPASLEAKHKRFVCEQNAMYAKWLPKLANDPAYNANLALNGPGFTLETNTDLTWRPLAWRPLPIVLAHNADPWGCGHYRIIKPHRAMRDEGLIDGAVADRLLEPAELLRLSPDVVVYQRQTKQESLDSMERSRRFSAAFKVYELDDYLPNTPIKSAHRSMMSKDLVKLLRKGLGYVDRFVVSTPALANALSDFHVDIRVVENRLPLDWWGQLALTQNASSKPRVGWAGGVGHQGDLDLIADVVRDLADEVDWVFFGMCPEKLRPYVAEYIPGIDIQLYPEKLASLRLDLALAPLEDNLFNACKSNLRLLEYGICGYPVIASDIECYRGGLPVTLVKNRYRDWMEVIRTHLADRQALAARGLHLREAIARDWMLTGACLESWRDAWLPD